MSSDEAKPKSSAPGDIGEQNRSLSSAGSRSKPNAGLCSFCTHSRWIESDRGSSFLLCRLSTGDDRFRKYPALPVASCIGYEPVR
jgi:hypothetical protein